ncbi:MAG: hypothetical protein E7374_03995 [Clostridiales bacterium]|nr:hypothetical protein [Clostridiales bacterium]
MSGNINELIEFNTACDEFMAGKYILIDIKINSLLRIIEEDEKIKNIVATCIDGFVFNENLGETLTVPRTEKGIIAYVYNLLYLFKTGEVDFYKFLSTYFSTDETSSSEDFISFAKSLILPFKEAINSIYAKRHILVESSDYQENHYNKIKNSTKIIVQNIDNFKLKMNEKDEFLMLLNSLYLASEKNDKKMVYSFMIALDYFSRVNKKTRGAYLMLEECFS